MAGIRCSCRNLFVFNTSRLLDKNGALLQLTRKRHHLVFQIPSLQNKVALCRPKLVYSVNNLLLIRLASTNITELKEPVFNPNLKISEVKNDSNQLNIEVAQLNDEPVQSSKGPDIIGSSNSNIIDESSLPPIPSEIAETPVLDFISMGLKEPTFHSIGLGSWWPSGIVQQMLEFLHINMDLPWWESILIFTFVVRCFMLPVIVRNRKDSVELSNLHIPKIMEFNEKMQKAKLRGDYFEVAFHNQELQKYIKENKINLFGFVKIMLVQAPVFISMYYALKGMASAPVESLKTGGLFWFSDLTQPDPYYLLPVILSGSLLAVIETGAEGNPNMTNTHLLKWILRGLSLIVFVFTLTFPACLTWYWSISNLISLCVVALFKVPFIKNFLKLPSLDQKAVMVFQKNQKGFLEGLKEGIENAKISGELQNRERMNLMAIQRAGSGPVPRTFKKNPILQNPKKSS